MLSQDIHKSIETVIKKAKEHRHEYLCVEHLLSALLENEWGREIILKLRR